MKVLKPIGYGGRHERGAILEMEETYVASFGPEYVVPVDSVETEDTGNDVEGEKEIGAMTVGELREKAKSLGLSTSGTKADLVERIELSQEEVETDEEDEDEDE